MSLAFGTDGIRGRAGIEPLTPTIIRKLGQAIVCSVNPSAKIIVGMDTRESSSWICNALCEGITSVGGNVLFGGVMPTAAVSCAVMGEKADRGIMITASHNPYHDNGIKIFSASGRKLNENQQKALLIAYEKTYEEPNNGSYIQADYLYVHWKRQIPKPDLSGIKILLDCAHGAAAPHAPQILAELGAELTLIGCEPTGTNINKNVGALHPPEDILGCDMAICFDGDADRLMMLDKYANLLDGDDILWLLRNHYKGPLVGTVLSNGGLEEALNGRLLRSAVGDANVEKCMHTEGALLGAEPSGHVLFADGLPTGDGMYTALQILECLKKAPEKPSWERWPVCTENIAITKRIDLGTLSSIKKAQDAGQRVIVRYSGTEPVLRMMVEGKEAQHYLQLIREDFLESCT